ncbi:hypothetical protein ACFYY3_28190 [Streptomyces sp. NPDC001812]|uniref:DUF3558 domain-containing protein n=1 Tax=Streptomyces cathayae TaxID=3031124 RepID=A0ABY8K010_9ACTN|nr:hypothetical protein [Streptomyces sp. HUAS 5]WGD41582.1 hypothetical protein PYS65_16225 [Streptomyces sp. HUAS 5]
MNRTTMKIRTLRSSLLLTSTLTALLISTTGCSSTGYEIPTTICGRAIDPSALQPLLPPGQNFEARHQISEEDQSACFIFIDKANALIISEIRDQSRFDVMEFAKQNRRSSDNPRKSEVGDDTVTSDDWLISMNACTGRGAGDYYVLDVSIARETGEAKPQELERFTQSYLPEAMKEMGCTQ